MTLPPRPAITQQPYPHQQLRPRLARRDQLGGPWGAPGFGASTAYISLSPGLVCVFDSPTASGLTHQEIGALGMTAHQAWNASAESLMRSALTDGNLEFWVRPATAALGPDAPCGHEVRGADGTGPAAWLAHPRTFQAVDRHFRTVLDAPHGLTFYSRDQRELFVFTDPEEIVADTLGRAGVIRYSLGFPLLAAGAALMA